MPRKYGSSTAVKRSVSQDSKGEATKEIIASLIRELFKRYDRCERAFQLAIMEMVVNGVSTRKVSHIVEELCGRQISQSKVSELGKGLSQKVNQFKNRPLGEYWDLRPLDNAHARHTKKKTQPKVVSF